MEKIKHRLLFIVSTLKRSGPTNQLYNLIKYLDCSCFEFFIITLSPEPDDSRWSDFENLGVSLHTLGLSRVKSTLLGKRMLCKFIGKIQPDLIHTHGFRSDVMVSQIKLTCPWFMTIHNYPYEDFPMKYGRIVGKVMAKTHVLTMTRCKHVIACSKSVGKMLSAHGICSHAIQNGGDLVEKKVLKQPSIPKFQPPVFITMGHLINRKNTSFLIEAFNEYTKLNKGSLVILGDGPDMLFSKELAKTENIHFMGRVLNVAEYLKVSDYYISASLSEGLPNAVLEALNVGLPVLLSDIPQHKEIAEEGEHFCHIFKLSDGVEALANSLANVKEIFSSRSGEESRRLGQTVFSAREMSRHYQKQYFQAIEGG